jgi:hypothetical protein
VDIEIDLQPSESVLDTACEPTSARLRERGAHTVPAAIVYGKSEARRRFWFWGKKIEGTDEQQS